MNERDHHDHFYEHEARSITNSPLMVEFRHIKLADLFRSVPVSPEAEVLSLGCGDGYIERLIAPRVKRIVGLDVSSVAISQAQQRASADGLDNTSFQVADLTCLESLEPLGRFDIVCAFSFLHHLGTDQAITQTLKAGRAVLKPNGVFYSIDPNARRLVRFFTGLVRQTYKRYHSPDEHELLPLHLCQLYQEAGFARTRISYLDLFLGVSPWLIPNCPRFAASGIAAMDRVLVKLPGLREHTNSFSVSAWMGV